MKCVGQRSCLEAGLTRSTLEMSSRPAAGNGIPGTLPTVSRKKNNLLPWTSDGHGTLKTVRAANNQIGFNDNPRLAPRANMYIKANEKMIA